jgi:exosome complex RNA-binding protein Rrp42 (RNase PH superfamily)
MSFIGHVDSMTGVSQQRQYPHLSRISMQPTLFVSNEDCMATTTTTSTISTSTTTTTTTATPIHPITISERDYIRQGCILNCRIDGRTRYDFRHYTIITNNNTKTAATTELYSRIPVKSSWCRNIIKTSYGSSRLYDTITQGQSMDLLCSIQAEMVLTSSQQQKQSQIPMELSIHTNPTASASNSSVRTAVLREYETRLQRYYIPCLMNAIQQQQQQQEDQDVLCIVPGQLYWKLYIDVQVLSSSHFESSSTMNVNYYDAMTHVINAAIQSTKLPRVSSSTSSSSSLAPGSSSNGNNHRSNSTGTASSSSSSLLDRIVLDSNIEQGRYIIPRQQKHSQHVVLLPILVTTHVIHYSPPSTKEQRHCNDLTTTTTTAALVAVVDASPEEEAIAVCAIHVVIVPTRKVPLQLSDATTTTSTCSATTKQLLHDDYDFTVGGVWNTNGSVVVGAIGGSGIPLSVLTQCIRTSQDVVAGQAYSNYQANMT